MFEEFVSFINGVVANFLPWILRGLEKLSEYGSEEAAAANWSDMAKEVEAALSARGGETAADESLVPIE
jgi:helicase